MGGKTFFLQRYLGARTFIKLGPLPGVKFRVLPRVRSLQVALQHHVKERISKVVIKIKQIEHYEFVWQTN